MRVSPDSRKGPNERDSFFARAVRYIRPHVGELLSFLLTSFTLILVQELVPEAPGIQLRGELTVLVCLLALAIELVVLYKRGEEEEGKALLMEHERRNRWAKAVLSGISRLPDIKADSIRKRSASMSAEREAWPFFYDPDEYLKRVCEGMRDAVARIMQCETDYVEVSLIYSVCREGHWRWPAGRSSASGAVDMDEFVRDESTLYSYILNNKGESPIFCNDKPSCGFYRPGRRDRLYGAEGSFYATLVTFASEEGPLVEAVLVISTYGLRFSNPKLGKTGEREFERNLAFEVLPYYLSIIQAELGAIYVRHEWGSAKTIDLSR